MTRDRTSLTGDATSTATAASMDATVRLAVGGAVVYAAHGVGHVVARERKLVAGVERDCLVIDLTSGLRVTLPVDAAADRLRRVLNEADLASVQKTLGGAPDGREGPWTRRIKDSKAKLARGFPLDLAELVRDGAPFEWGAEKGVPRLSSGERSVYLQARRLLVREICSARAMEHAQADTWIETQIASKR